MTETLDLSKYKMVFSDEFDEINLLGQSDGFWRPYGYWGTRTLPGNGEKQLYVDPSYKNLGLNPFSVQDGILTIRAEPASAEIKAQIDNLDYTSGMISSERGFSMQYGYFEIRAQMPTGKGLWPAFWMLTLDGQWPPELDVVEVLGKEPDKLYGTSHYKDESGSHKKVYAVALKGMFDSSDGFHTYGIDWQEDKVVWYYDGIKVGETANKITNQPAYLVANLAVGGYWPGNPDGNTPFPADMKIDYIRAYQKTPDHQLVGIPTGWATVGIEDFTVLSRISPVTSYAWRYTMKPEDTNAVMSGDGSRFLTANDKNNFLGGSSSSYNELDGGRGDDTLQGGRGTDIFVIRNGRGNDVILDFSNTVNNTDKIRLDGFHFRHADDVLVWARQMGSDVLLRLDEDQALLLKNLSLNALTPDVFIFTNPVAVPANAPVLSDISPDTPTPPEEEAPPTSVPPASPPPIGEPETEPAEPETDPIPPPPPTGPIVPGKLQPHPRSDVLEYRIREGGSLWKSYEEAVAESTPRTSKAGQVERHADADPLPGVTDQPQSSTGQHRSVSASPMLDEVVTGMRDDILPASDLFAPVLDISNTVALQPAIIGVPDWSHSTIFDRMLLH